MSSNRDMQFEEELKRNGLSLKETVNASGLRPKGHAVLTEPFVEKKEGSLIVLPANVAERTQMLQDKVRIIAIGAACWNDEPEPRAKVGDLVLIPYLAGRMTEGRDKKHYRIINDRDVICEVEE